jgi:hypothetical protein
MKKIGYIIFKLILIKITIIIKFWKNLWTEQIMFASLTILDYQLYIQRNKK